MMRCPSCQQRPLTFSAFIQTHPFKPFTCHHCDTRVQFGLLVRGFCWLTLALAFAGFYYLFPWLDTITDTGSKTESFFLDLALPPAVITIYIFASFIPATLYAWFLGDVELARPETAGHEGKQEKD